MPTVADYAVLRDTPFDIEKDGTHPPLVFFRPDNFVEGTNLAKAVLAFKCQPLNTNNSVGVTFRVQRFAPGQEPTVMETMTLNTPTVHALWETFPAKGFGQNVSPGFEFDVLFGRARISDVILWYQVRV